MKNDLVVPSLVPLFFFVLRVNYFQYQIVNTKVIDTKKIL